MVMNIIEILVTLPLALSNIVLGTQVVMLDVGGFSLATMGEQARDQGNDRAAHRASLTGYFLIAVTIVTLLLVTVGLLWSPAKEYTDMAEKGLILVRVVMTVIYAHVIHSLRRATQTPPALVPSADVYARLDAYSEQLQLVQTEMQRHMREVQGSVSPLVQSVVQAQTHAIMSELQGVQSHLDNAVQSQIKEVSALVHSLTRHTPEQGHETTVEQGQSGQVKRGTKRVVNPSITLVHSLTNEQGNGQDNEPLEQRIKRYILEQRRQNSEPSLAEIMDRCSCSKGSVIRYRRELNESSATEERKVVGE